MVMRYFLRVTRIGRLYYISRCRRTSALPFGLSDVLKVGDGDQPSSAGYQWIAGFIPIRIVFPTNHMKEIAFSKA